MDKQAIQALFRRHFRGMPNILTPNVLQFGQLTSDLFYELAEGTDFTNHQPLYGVTVLCVIPEVDGTEKTYLKYGASKCLKSCAEVEAHLASLANPDFLPIVLPAKFGIINPEVKK